MSSTIQPEVERPFAPRTHINKTRVWSPLYIVSSDGAYKHHPLCTIIRRSHSQTIPSKMSPYIGISSHNHRAHCPSNHVCSDYLKWGFRTPMQSQSRGNKPHPPLFCTHNNNQPHLFGFHMTNNLQRRVRALGDAVRCAVCVSWCEMRRDICIYIYIDNAEHRARPHWKGQAHTCFFIWIPYIFDSNHAYSAAQRLVGGGAARQARDIYTRNVCVNLCVFGGRMCRKSRAVTRPRKGRRNSPCPKDTHNRWAEKFV